MKGLRKLSAWLMCLVTIFSLLSAYVPATKTARAAEAAAPFTPFTKDEFLKCYVKVLVDQLGHDYAAASYEVNVKKGIEPSGYMLGGVSYKSKGSRITSGTPYEPLSIDAKQTFDCDGLVLTCLMAMGYDYFEGQNGKKYYLNGYYGGGLSFLFLELI